jgi:hypothetical protein
VLDSGCEHLNEKLLLQFFVECFLCVSVLGRMVDALASGADEGRGRLRYASGSCQPSVDPRMSEWGNPARVMSCHLLVNV